MVKNLLNILKGSDPTEKKIGVARLNVDVLASRCHQNSWIKRLVKISATVSHKMNWQPLNDKFSLI